MSSTEDYLIQEDGNLLPWNELVDAVVVFGKTTNENFATAVGNQSEY